MIGATLRAAAAFVDDNASGAAWDPHQRLSDEQRFAKGDNIRALADGLRGLADASETRKPRCDEYEAFEERLHAYGFSLSKAVATAFHGDGGDTGLQRIERIARS